MKLHSVDVIQDTCQKRGSSSTIKGTKSRKRSRSERGSSLIETALVLPVFLVLLGAVVDGGIVVQQYFMLHRIASSGLRIAVTTPNLTEGKYVDLDSPGSARAHYELHQRIKSLVSLYGDDMVGYVKVTSERLDDTQTILPPASKEKSSRTPLTSEVGARKVTTPIVNIEVEMVFPAFLGRFTNQYDWKIRGNSTGSYLAFSNS